MLKRSVSSISRPTTVRLFLLTTRSFIVFISALRLPLRLPLRLSSSRLVAFLYPRSHDPGASIELFFLLRRVFFPSLRPSLSIDSLFCVLRLLARPRGLVASLLHCFRDKAREKNLKEAASHKKKNEMSGTEFARTKEAQAEIMRKKQEAGS
ncbi:uncharacterized protein ARB_01667 [Trichophyton benhamiae CBS 112371]|uniref:Small EDRK-rich factor-like N-terminal domain-containing protein n=1 Tax=Arthroderma benhamiae (strain ATCC MYA-4681 / CBS 112371) TaxID=663331 RepID=D4AZP9_ARTBC|nr:uncharacterized protein ARB_01667 [Trichophyton benhamiae CBS 112371]EFE31519.1 hypothetical protein ARB_01667 [Trichophyton benhamiae CBS 112371]